MIKEQFFPTIVYGFDVKLDNDKLAQNIITWSNQDKGLQKTNVQGWHSPTDMQTKPEYKPLVDQLFLAMRQVWDDQHLDREAKLGNMWANINPPGGYNNSHIHPNSLFSGVYYIKTPPKSGRLQLMDPRTGGQQCMPARKKGKIPPELWREIFCEAIPGRMIMFPAWMWHKVETNQSNDIRISVSFNFIIR